MSEAFLKAVNMSISAGWLVLAVLALRVILKKAPKWVNVLPSGIVAVRLICPFSIESALSLIPSTETISPEIIMDWTPEISTGIDSLDQVVNPVISTSFAPNPGTSANPLQILIPVAANLWLLGVIIMLAYTAISYLTLRRKLRTAVILRGNIFQCETVSSPFVLGILKPRIYLPYAMDGKNLDHVVAHEQAHIQRKDHWWKPLGFLLLTVYWFNPLMWVAYILLCRDIELACDEKVIAELGNEQRADYTQALVTCAVNRRMIAACPLAFGEVGVKDRVKSIMNYRKPTFWIIVTALVVCAVVAVCFLTNPKRSTIYDIYEQDGYAVIDQDEVDVTLYVDKTKLPDSIYTPEGHEFDENEVVVYSTETTKVYLYKAMISNESDDQLYFIFDFSYDFPKSGSIISPYKYIDDQDGMQSNLYLKSKDLRDVNTTYPEALNIRGYGPDTQFAFYVSKEACQAANRTLIIDIVCNQIVYTKDGHGYESQQGSSESTPDKVNFEAEVLEFHDGYILVKPEPSWAINSADQIEVPMKNMDPALEPQVGDIIEISYSGEILETYPARLKEVYSIRVIGETTKLTLNDVIILSQYGYDLSWSDFDDFEYIETGFGLYIRRYEINDLFHFAIGGAGPNSEPMYMHLGANGDDPDAYIDIRDGGVTEFISEHNTATVNFTGNLNLGLNAEIIEIDSSNRILYVKDIDKQAKVFGDRCAIDCNYAISRDNLLYVNYGDPNDLWTISFGDLEVGDTLIIALYDSEKEKAYNGSATAEQIQLGTQRLSTEAAFEFNFGGNTSGGQKLELTEDKPYWCIFVENHGSEKIVTEIGGDVCEIEPGTFDTVFSDEKWKPGTYTVSFATAGPAGMTGNAVCYTYKYRIEITGRLHNAVKDTTYILLTNIEGITFDQAWKASGLSSNMDDYFDPADAVFIGIR